MVTLLTFMFLAADEANGPTAKYPQRVRKHTLPWLISHAGRWDTVSLALDAATVSRTELFFEHYQINQCGSRQAGHDTREEEKEL